MIMMSSVLESAPPNSRYLSPLAVSQNPFRSDQMGGLIRCNIVFDCQRCGKSGRWTAETREEEEEELLTKYIELGFWFG